MIIRRLDENDKAKFNLLVDHPLQTWEWGNFKKKVGMEAIRLGVFEGGRMINGFQILTKDISKTSFKVAHCLKSGIPGSEALKAMKELQEEENIIFIKLEPDVLLKKWKNKKGNLSDKQETFQHNMVQDEKLQEAKRPFFDIYSYLLNLTKSEEDLMMNMHRKTRYNVRLAKRKGVKIIEDSSSESLGILIELMQETLKRQNFYLHSPTYFREMWRTLKPTNIPRILLAKYKGKVLAAWMLFIWDKKLYYPYGASSDEFREVMASNLICWEAILYGKKEGCTVFDMWGAGQGPNPDKSHPWYGFYRFKKGYGADLVKFIGSWDLVNSPLLYTGIQTANSIRWKLLRAKKKLGV